MNIRTITVGVPVAKLSELADLEGRIDALGATLVGAFAKQEVSVRTQRVCLGPIRSEADTRFNPEKVLGGVRALAAMCERLGIRWFNVPFDLTQAEGASLEALSTTAFDVIRHFERSFINVMVARDGQIAGQAIPLASRLIKDVARLDTSGYHNFRVGVACNTKANTPFFPFSYSSDEPGFSLGLEMSQELIGIAQVSKELGLSELRAHFLEVLTPRLQAIEDIAREGAEAAGLQYHGIDISIAPYPEPNNSVGQLMELLCLDQFGTNGTMFVTSFLTGMLKELLRRSQIKSTGFNGVMLSLLEDEVLGLRNDRRLFGIDSLILYSTVCGCGVDMVPVPGDIFEEEISAIIADTAAASCTLQKPLGVRLLPIPHRHESDFTEFQMDFLFNTRIQRIRNLGLLPNKLETFGPRRREPM